MGRSNNKTRLLVDGEVLYKEKPVQRLSLKYKSLWVYIVLTADSSGFWEPEFDVAGLRIGAGIDGVTEEEATKEFAGMFDRLSSGVWFIPSRIQHANKHGLNSESKNHMWIFRNWVELGVDVEKYSFLLQDQPAEFVKALKEIGKYPSAVYDQQTKKNLLGHQVDHSLDHQVVANGNGNGLEVGNGIGTGNASEPSEPSKHDYQAKALFGKEKFSELTDSQKKDITAILGEPK